MDLRAMREVRKLQENPELGEFRIHAALARIGIDLSPRTCGRILAVNSSLYGLEKPKRGSKEKEMPFQSARRHEIWSVDIRYIDHHLPESELPEGGGKVYVISILENHSRAILASAITTAQDTTAYLSVLYTAVERYGSPCSRRYSPTWRLFSSGHGRVFRRGSPYTLRYYGGVSRRAHCTLASTTYWRPKGEDYRVVGGLALGIVERAYGPYVLVVHVFGGWEQFPLYDAARSSIWYDFGFLLGAGSPVLGASGRGTQRGG